ncbi:MAG TPA: M28 family peptidase [Candidatus Kryptonia bacterium]|nr:M28 family peptidase [Candidatus Kryptonia bacterium]
MPQNALIPAAEAMLAWIERVYSQGIRRPGYPADQWAEQFCRDQFRELGLENVRLDPVPLAYWEPRAAALRVHAGGTTHEIACFGVPFSAPVANLVGDLAGFDHESPERVRGKVALNDVTLLRVPPEFPVLRRRGDASEPAGLAAAAERAGWCFDPRGTFNGALQVLPFGREIQHVMEPSIAAGAIGFIGSLPEYPGGGYQYYVPYDGISRPIPGVWINGGDGERLRAWLGAGPVRVELSVDARAGEFTSHNVIGELPGADDEIVVVGTHHDGPWSSAVEDGSGIALVLAQATYWAAVPRVQRPHRLQFLVNAGHMAGGAGCRAYLERYAAVLDRIVLEVHLEHAAAEFVERDGQLVPSGEPEPRWWFTSRIPQLETAVWNAIVAEGLERSLLLTPDALAPFPTTDGGMFHLGGVPLVNFLTAPFYLFDPMDRLDKIHVPSLVPITRAAIRIIESTNGMSAAAMRAARAA